MGIKDDKFPMLLYILKPYFYLSLSWSIRLYTLLWKCCDKNIIFRCRQKPFIQAKRRTDVQSELRPHCKIFLKKITFQFRLNDGVRESRISLTFQWYTTFTTPCQWMLVKISIFPIFSLTVCIVAASQWWAWQDTQVSSLVNTVWNYYRKNEKQTPTKWADKC